MGSSFNKEFDVFKGFDDFSEARCIVVDGEVSIQSACVEVGQGFVTLNQIVEETLGVSEAVILPVDTSIGSAGSTSASSKLGCLVGRFESV